MISFISSFSGNRKPRLPMSMFSCFLCSHVFNSFYVTSWLYFLFYSSNFGSDGQCAAKIITEFLMAKYFVADISMNSMNELSLRSNRSACFGQRGGMKENNNEKVTLRGRNRKEEMKREMASVEIARMPLNGYDVIVWISIVLSLSHSSYSSNSIEKDRKCNKKSTIHIL